MAAKFKDLRRVLKKWGIGLSKRKAQIKACNEVLAILDKLDENRALNPLEWKLRSMVTKLQGS
jgi:hypothetical protein